MPDMATSADRNGIETQEGGNGPRRPFNRDTFVEPPVCGKSLWIDPGRNGAGPGACDNFDSAKGYPGEGPDRGCTIEPLTANVTSWGSAKRAMANGTLLGSRDVVPPDIVLFQENKFKGDEKLTCAKPKPYLRSRGYHSLFGQAVHTSKS